MAVNDVETILLRQSVPQIFPAFAAIIRPADTKRSFDGGACHITIGGSHPGLIRIVFSNGNGKSKPGGAFRLAYVLPGFCAVSRTKDPAVVLLPEIIRVSWRCDKNVRIVAYFRVGIRKEIGS